MGNRMFSETTITMFFIVRWMELSLPDIDNKFTGLITLNCSDLFPQGIGLGGKIIGQGARNEASSLVSRLRQSPGAVPSLARSRSAILSSNGKDKDRLTKADRN